ncbi:hypothetical protein WN51_11170 [Melipona quadrifasciata]|uniref:Uncharacterized protein n=1 Tax=Melipona quadrifasciata TaxID=166423 RepID=A0A0M9A6C8_9HYME|nr:hypothetical protein WN51_11170 [Melipona quadrifasciata]
MAKKSSSFPLTQRTVASGNFSETRIVLGYESRSFSSTLYIPLSRIRGSVRIFQKGATWFDLPGQVLPAVSRQAAAAWNVTRESSKI